MCWHFSAACVWCSWLTRSSVFDTIKHKHKLQMSWPNSKHFELVCLFFYQLPSLTSNTSWCQGPDECQHQAKPDELAQCQSNFSMLNFFQIFRALRSCLKCLFYSHCCVCACKNVTVVNRTFHMSAGGPSRRRALQPNQVHKFVPKLLLLVSTYRSGCIKCRGCCKL